MRPCLCDNFVPGEPYQAGRDCRRCWLYHNDERYRVHWGNCRHRGEVIERIELPVCTTGRTRPYPIYSCQIHGRCIHHGTCDEMVIEFAGAVKRGESPPLWQCNLCKDYRPTDERPPGDGGVQLSGVPGLVRSGPSTNP